MRRSQILLQKKSYFLTKNIFACSDSDENFTCFYLIDSKRFLKKFCVCKIARTYLLLFLSEILYKKHENIIFIILKNIYTKKHARIASVRKREGGWGTEYGYVKKNTRN